MPTLPPLDQRTWRALTRLVAAGAVAAHIGFVARDSRLPPDLNRVFTDLPTLYSDLGSVSTWGHALTLTFTHTTGWYNFLIAAASQIAGRPSAVFEIGLIAWFAVLLWATASLADRLAGPAAACVAVALTASAPSVFAFARQGWVHVLEAAIALTLLAIWSRDAGLVARRTRVGIAVGGILLLWTRTSGLIFAASVLVAMASGWRVGGPGYFRRAAWAVGPWSVGLIPVIAVGQNYMSDKLASRARYFDMVRPLSEQLPDDLGWSVLALLVAGVAALAYGWKRDAHEPTAFYVLGTWVVVGFSLVFVFGVGIDNFTVIVPAAAVLAGVGLVRVHERLALAPLVLWIPVAISFWLPQSQAGALLQIVPGTPKGMRDDHADNFLRVYNEFGVAEIRRLLDATCPSRDTVTCYVGVDRGLFRPSPEEPGALELFLMGEHHVELNSLAEARVIPGRLDAVARYGCTQSDIGWVRRFPRAFYNTQMITSAQGLTIAWKKVLSGNCSFEWYTKNGRVANVNALPKGDPLGQLRRGPGGTMGGGMVPGTGGMAVPNGMTGNGTGMAAPGPGGDVFIPTGPRYPNPATLPGATVPVTPTPATPPPPNGSR